MTAVSPLHNYILVKLDEAEEEDIGHGFVVPSIAQKTTATGVIEKIGPDVPPGAGFSVGDRVLFPPFGVGIPYQPKRSEKYLFLFETEIIGIVE